MISGNEFKGAAEKLRRSGGPREIAELLDQAAGEQRPVAAPQGVRPDADESPTLGALATALAKAQGEMHHALKDQANEFLGTRYADLASVIDACRKPLADNGLAYVQRVSVSTDRSAATISTMLLHSSGEWIRDRLTVTIEQQVSHKGGKQPWVQAYGSAVTYGRRYALSALVGIAAGEDDDGEAAREEEQREAGPQRPSALEAAKAKLTKQLAQGVELKGEPVAHFGAKDVKGRKLAELGADHLTQLLEVGRDSIKRSPKADWAPTVAANLEQIEAEVERRIEREKKAPALIADEGEPF